MEEIKKAIQAELQKYENNDEVRLHGAVIREMVNIEIEKRINKLKQGMFPNM